MEAIILRSGISSFKVPHICKRKLERTGQLHVSIKVLDSVKEKLKFFYCTKFNYYTNARIFFSKKKYNF